MIEELKTRTFTSKKKTLYEDDECLSERRLSHERRVDRLDIAIVMC
jgi:hypothetical protein